jgi:hypothetical protein
MKMLSKEQKEDSYDAVRQLLLHGDENSAEHGGLVECKIKVGPQESQAEILFSAMNHVPAFTLDSTTMHSFIYRNGKKSPLSTAYEYFEWDDQKKLLRYDFGSRFPMEIKRTA